MNNPYRLDSDGRPMDVMEMYVDVFGTGRSPSYEQKKAVYEYIRRGFMEFVNKGPTRVEIRRKEVLRMLKLWRKFIKQDMKMSDEKKKKKIKRLRKRTGWNGKKELKDFENMDVSINYFEIAQSVYRIREEDSTISIVKKAIKNTTGELRQLAESLGFPRDVYDSGKSKKENLKNISTYMMTLSKRKTFHQILIDPILEKIEKKSDRSYPEQSIYREIVCSNPNYLFSVNGCGNLRYVKDVQESYKSLYDSLLEKYDEIWNSTQTIDIDTILEGLVHNSSLRCGVDNPNKNNLYTTTWYDEKFIREEVWNSIYPLLGKDCEFTYNSFLYGFVNGISVYGIPIEDEMVDGLSLCPQNFLRHDLDHTSIMCGLGGVGGDETDKNSYLSPYAKSVFLHDYNPPPYRSKSDMYSKVDIIAKLYNYIHTAYEDPIKKEIMIYALWYIVHENSNLEVFNDSEELILPIEEHLDMQRYGEHIENMVKSFNEGQKQKQKRYRYKERIEYIFSQAIVREFNDILRKLGIEL